MFKSIRGVALRTVRYNDRNSILTAWTAELGRTALLMPDGAGRESRRRRALTMPLSLFEGQVDVRPGREIMTVRDMRPLAVTTALSAHPVKAALAMFLAEVLQAVLRDAGQADPVLWRLIHDTVTALDRAPDRALANFHLWFLYRLGVVIGIEPDTSTFERGRVFDMADGIFRDSAPGHADYVEAAEARIVVILGRLSERSLPLLRMSSERRSRALDGILRYYTLHHSPLNALHSLPVLRTLLHP